MGFWIGFEKRGLDKVALQKTRLGEAALSAGLGVLPLGTTIHSSVSDRPKGHSRLTEWGGRVGANVLGAVVIDALTRGHSTTAPILGGALAEGAADYLMKGKYYDKGGKLKKEYQK